MDRQQERLIEWACQKVLRQYYTHVDQYEYEDAAALFTDDATWKVMGVDLKGRDQILEGLYAGLQKGTIRHVLTNTVVTVIDEDHAEARSYNNIYYSPRARTDETEGALPFDGPNRISDHYASFTRTDDGWKMSSRVGRVIFRSKAEELALETWAGKEGLLLEQKS
ncbi:MAG: nuclear transport factor 2 family protein [Pirellulaceae bacterium]|nr:nuclear transport factor 2 family protein [Pirellulaceae bacterium]